MKLSAVILAAGASRRVGFPKALLRIGGETFTRRLVRLLAPYTVEQIVVLGHEAELLESKLWPELQGFPVRLVVNRAHHLGQFSSLKWGLENVSCFSEAVVFTPVDFAGVSAQTIKAVVNSFVAGQPRVAVCKPRYRDLNGHPVCINREVIKAVLEAPVESNAREVLRQFQCRTQLVEVNDPWVIRDVDNFETYQELLSERPGPKI